MQQRELCRLQEQQEGVLQFVLQRVVFGVSVYAGSMGVRLACLGDPRGVKTPEIKKEKTEKAGCCRRKYDGREGGRAVVCRPRNGSFCVFYMRKKNERRRVFGSS